MTVTPRWAPDETGPVGRATRVEQRVPVEPDAPVGTDAAVDSNAPAESIDRHEATDPVEHRAGPPVRVVQLVTTMARGGAQATVIGSSAGMDPSVRVIVLAGRDTTEEGTYWGSAELRAVDTIVVPRLVRSLSPKNDLAALWWLVRWLRRNRPDVMHTHSSKAGVLGRIAARLVGIPCAHTVHGWGPVSVAPRSVRFAVLMIERLLARLSDALVVVGRPDLDFGLDRQIGDPSRYRLIRSGVDTSTAEAAAAERTVIRTELGLDGRYVVGMVARMSPQKDHTTLLHAFAGAAIPDSTLVLIGDGPLRTEVAALAERLDIADRVQFLGMRSDAARLVAGFDVSVLSSRWEGMPRTVVEAAAAGVPVIATDVGAVSELIEDGRAGTLVPPGDVVRLTAALQAVRGEPSVAGLMADTARAATEQFSIEHMRSELTDLWRDLGGRQDQRRQTDRPRPRAR
ncbi:MAG: glycosyltransferase family 4 protein [Actinomycetota bacterium]